jgi:hypothetical protein
MLWWNPFVDVLDYSWNHDGSGSPQAGNIGQLLDEWVDGVVGFEQRLYADILIAGGIGDIVHLGEPGQRISHLLHPVNVYLAKDVYRYRKTKEYMVYQHCGCDGAAFNQPVDAVANGFGGRIQLPGDLGAGDAPVFLEQANDTPVKLVESSLFTHDNVLFGQEYSIIFPKKAQQFRCDLAERFLNAAVDISPHD